MHIYFWFEWTLACLAAAALQYFMLFYFHFFFTFHFTLYCPWSEEISCLACYCVRTEAVDLNELEHGELKSRLKCGAISSVHWSAGVLLFVLWSGTFFFPPGVNCFLSMVVKYSSLDLQRLNSFYRLPGEIYNRCAALGIIRHPRYIHRGSHRDFLVRSVTPSQDNDYIPVIWSSYRHSSIGSNGKSRCINFGNITLLKDAPLSSQPVLLLLRWP